MAGEIPRQPRFTVKDFRTSSDIEPQAFFPPKASSISFADAREQAGLPKSSFAPPDSTHVTDTLGHALAKIHADQAGEMAQTNQVSAQEQADALRFDVELWRKALEDIFAGSGIIDAKNGELSIWHQQKLPRLEQSIKSPSLALDGISYTELITILDHMAFQKPMHRSYPLEKIVSLIPALLAAVYDSEGETQYYDAAPAVVAQLKRAVKQYMGMVAGPKPDEATVYSFKFQDDSAAIAVDKANLQMLLNDKAHNDMSRAKILLEAIFSKPQALLVEAEAKMMQEFDVVNDFVGHLLAQDAGRALNVKQAKYIISNADGILLSLVQRMKSQDAPSLDQAYSVLQIINKAITKEVISRPNPKLAAINAMFDDAEAGQLGTISPAEGRLTPALELDQRKAMFPQSYTDTDAIELKLDGNAEDPRLFAKWRKEMPPVQFTDHVVKEVLRGTGLSHDELMNLVNYDEPDMQMSFEELLNFVNEVGLPQDMVHESYSLILCLTQPETFGIRPYTDTDTMSILKNIRTALIDYKKRQG